MGEESRKGQTRMRHLILILIDLLWLVASLGFLAGGAFVLLKKREQWKRAMGFVAIGAVLMAARFLDPVWHFIHTFVGI